MIQRYGNGNKKDHASVDWKSALKQVANRREKQKLSAVLPSQCI
jgi:hypothetical protein